MHFTYDVFSSYGVTSFYVKQLLEMTMSNLHRSNRLMMEDCEDVKATVSTTYEVLYPYHVYGFDLYRWEGVEAGSNYHSTTGPGGVRPLFYKVGASVRASAW